MSANVPSYVACPECDRCGQESAHLTETPEDGWLCEACCAGPYCAEEGGLSPLGVAMARQLLGELQVELATEAEKAKAKP